MHPARLHPTRTSGHGRSGEGQLSGERRDPAPVVRQPESSPQGPAEAAGSSSGRQVRRADAVLRGGVHAASSASTTRFMTSERALPGCAEMIALPVQQQPSVFAQRLSASLSMQSFWAALTNNGLRCMLPHRGGSPQSGAGFRSPSWADRGPSYNTSRPMLLSRTSARADSSDFQLRVGSSRRKMQ